jgi:hypothetical protein
MESLKTGAERTWIVRLRDREQVHNEGIAAAIPVSSGIPRNTPRARVSGPAEPAAPGKQNQD